MTNSVVALGDADNVEGFALAGVTVLRAADPAEVRQQWNALGDDVGLVILDASAADTLGAARYDRHRVLTVVMPP